MDYKRSDFINEFEIDKEKNIILRCPDNRVPFKNEYDSNLDIMKGYFSKYECDKCIKKISV